MRFIFFVFFCFFCIFLLKSQPEKWEKEANLLYDKQLYSEAKKKYSTLYQQNIYSEKILYRLAYLCEREGSYAEAVYYLRKVQQQYGGEGLNDRIGKALENTGSGGMILENEHNFHHSLLRNTPILLGIVAVLTLFSLYLIVRLKKNKIARFLGISVLLLCILPEMGLIQAYFFQAQEAIIMKETAFYEAPSFAAACRPALYAPGTSCEILEKQDMWNKVALNDKEYWVPAFVLRTL